MAVFIVTAEVSVYQIKDFDTVKSEGKLLEVTT